MNSIETYLKHEYLARRSVYIEFAVRWIIWINTLSSQEVYDVLGAIFISIRCRHLYLFRDVLCGMRNKKLVYFEKHFSFFALVFNTKISNY